MKQVAPRKSIWTRCPHPMRTLHFRGKRALARAMMTLGVAGPILMSAASSGWSQEPALPEGSAVAGKTLASRCGECHGPDGLSETEGFPHLAGQHSAYMYKALGEYKDGVRQGEAMREVVAELSVQDMANLAAHFASLVPFSRRAATAREQADAAETIDADPLAPVREATAICAGCHGEDGNSELPGTPSLAGQHASYLIAAMVSYREGTRREETMLSFTESLSDGEIEEMAYFYAAMDPKRSQTPVSGDPYAGLAATASCAGCHGEDGNTTDPKMPRLAGLDADYLETSASAYRNGERDHPAMEEAIASLRQMDTKDMAAHYASRDPKALPVRKPLTTAEWAERCNRCHGQNGNSTDPRFPILAGQDRTYLVSTLKQYHGSERTNSLMQAMSFPMGESDIERMAAYYGRQRAP